MGIKPAELASALGGAKQDGTGWWALCPAHADKNPSLHIFWKRDGGTGFTCMAACDPKAVFKAVAEKVPQAFPRKKSNGKTLKIIATYDYLDDGGNLLYQVCRLEPKSFRQRKPDGKGGWEWKLGDTRRVLFHLPEINKFQGITVVEGEKDALALAELGIPATCNVGGAGKWHKSYTKTLEGKRVAVIADSDPPDPKTGKSPGHEHGVAVATALSGATEWVRLIECPPPHRDVSEWIAAGATKADILLRIRGAEEFNPASTPAPPAPPAEIHEHPEGSWQQGLLVTEKGYPRPLVANALHAIRAAPALKEMVSFDVFSQRPVLRRETPWGTPAGRQWADHDDTLLAEWLQRQGIAVGIGVAAQAATAGATEFPSDSLREWLTGLRWDGQPRLGRVADYFGAPDDLSREMMRRWMISAVARAMSPGVQVDHVIVLEAAQGKRKSTALRALFDPLDRGWFRDELPPLDSKDSALQLVGAWCIEIAELDAVNSRRSEIEKVKAFLTRRVDSYRPPYGRRVIDLPRRCVLAGSTNEHQYLRDSTGNRRWWPIVCGKINVDALEEDRNQFWAEAMIEFERGELWWFEEGTDADILEQQELRRAADPWEASIGKLLAMNYALTLDEVFQHLGIQLEKRRQADSNRISRIIQHFGWFKKRLRLRGGLPWYYVNDRNITGFDLETPQTGGERLEPGIIAPGEQVKLA